MLNEFKIIGRVTQNPSLRKTGTQKSVTNISLACNYQVKNDQSGQYEDKVDFVNLVAWNKKAESLAQHATKGRLLYVSGTIKQKKEEINGKNYTFPELWVESFKYLDSVKSDANSETMQFNGTQAPHAPSNNNFGGAPEQQTNPYTHNQPQGNPYQGQQQYGYPGTPQHGYQGQPQHAYQGGNANPFQR